MSVDMNAEVPRSITTGSCAVGNPIAIGLAPVETQSFVQGANSPAAFIVACDEWDLEPNGASWHRRYYLWLFGPMFRLPFEGTVDRATQDGLWFF